LLTLALARIESLEQTQTRLAQENLQLGVNISSFFLLLYKMRIFCFFDRRLHWVQWRVVIDAKQNQNNNNNNNNNKSKNSSKRTPVH
jgi:hypothetical protein